MRNFSEQEKKLLSGANPIARYWLAEQLKKRALTDKIRKTFIYLNLVEGNIYRKWHQNCREDMKRIKLHDSLPELYAYISKPDVSVVKALASVQRRYAKETSKTRQKQIGKMIAKIQRLAYSEKLLYRRATEQFAAGKTTNVLETIAAAIENITGEPFDPASIKTLDDLTAKIHVTDYILDEDRKSQMGRSVLLDIDAHDMTTCTEPETMQSEYKTEAFTPDMSAALHQYKIRTTGSFAELYTKILPKQLGWNRTMVKFWEAVTLQNAVDQDEKFRRCGIDPADQLARYFIQSICLSNYFLSKHKPVQLDKDAGTKEPDTESIKKEPVLQPIDPNQPIKHVRKVGVIQFVSNKPPRKPSQKTARQYHVAVWTVRGHVRKYANGKTVYIRPTVRRRKALQDHINSRPQNIIEFHDNAKEAEKS